MRSAAIPLLLLLLCVPVTPAVSGPIPELRSGIFPAEVAVEAGHETRHVRFAGAVMVDNHSGSGVVVTLIASNGVGAGMMPVLVLMVVLVVLLSGHAALRRRRRKR